MPIMILAGLVVIIMAVFSQGGKNEPYSGNNNQVVNKAAPIIKHFEGFRADAYLCPAGKLTVGYGHVIQPGDPHHVTKPQAAEWLKQELHNDYLPDTLYALESRGFVLRTMTTGEIAAALSAVYNNGAIIIYDGTWVDKIQSGKTDLAANWFYKWSKHRDPATGKLVRSKGLVRRRFAEWMLYTSGSWVQQPPGYKDWYEAHR